MVIDIGGENFVVNVSDRTVFHPATRTTVGFYECKEPIFGRFSPMAARLETDRDRMTMAQIALATQAINKVAA